MENAIDPFEHPRALVHISHVTAHTVGDTRQRVGKARIATMNLRIQKIENPNLMPRCVQGSRCVRPDKACAAGEQYIHRISFQVSHSQNCSGRTSQAHDCAIVAPRLATKWLRLTGCDSASRAKYEPGALPKPRLRTWLMAGRKPANRRAGAGSIAPKRSTPRRFFP